VLIEPGDFQTQLATTRRTVQAAATNEAYRDAFAICGGLAVAAAALCLLMRETGGRNIYRELYPLRETA